VKGGGREGEACSASLKDLSYCMIKPGPGCCRGAGEGLAATAGGVPVVLGAGLEGAGILVVLLAPGVSASNTLWREPVCELGGDGFSLSVAVSITLPAGGGRRIAGEQAVSLRVREAGRLGRSLNRTVCSSSQLVQWDGEEEQQLGVVLRLPQLEVVRLGDLWLEWVGLREQRGHTGSDNWHR